MKLSKKVLAAFSVAAMLATAAVFTSCGEDESAESDDANGMITKNGVMGNDYTLSYDNTKGADTSRAFVVTKNDHRGALTNITLNKDYISGNTASMGYIWDLYCPAASSADEVARVVSDKARTFCIFGFNYDADGYSGKVRYYVSRFTNVWDIYADNFGTKGVTVNGVTQNAVETEYLGWTGTSQKRCTAFTPNKDADGNIVVTVAVMEGGEMKKESFDSPSWNSYDGSYNVFIFNGKYSSEELDAMDDATLEAALVDTVNIPAADLGYTAGQRVTQRQSAVYANVYKGKKSEGSWHYDETYSADEVVEE